MNRRKFIKTTLATAAALNTSYIFAGDKEKKLLNGLTHESITEVSAVKGNNLTSITKDVINKLGGIKTIINKGDTVFIKPNFVTFPWAQYNDCFNKGECTKPDLLIAVSEECLKAGASEVIIGEGSHLPEFDWNFAVTIDGSTNLVKEAARLSSDYYGKVTLACLEKDSPGWVEVPSQTNLNKIAISSLATEADKVISIPVAKTHSWAQLTLGMKNFIGITPLSRYAQFINNSYWNRGTLDHSSPQAIAQVYLDIVKALRPALTIIDFSIGLEGDGPTTDLGGKPVNMKDRLGSWMVLASKDIVAADSTAARIMSHDPAEVKQLTMAYAMQLGEMRKNNIKIVGEKLEELIVPWAPARLKSNF